MVAVMWENSWTVSREVMGVCFGMSQLVWRQGFSVRWMRMKYFYELMNLVGKSGGALPLVVEMYRLSARVVSVPF